MRRMKVSGKILVTTLAFLMMTTAKAHRICTMEYAIMKNDRANQCMEARNGCLISDLQQIGFHRASEEECDQSQAGWVEFEYPAVCTRQVATMIQPHHRFCVTAINGCQINNLTKLGFQFKRESDDCEVTANNFLSEIL